MVVKDSEKKIISTFKNSFKSLRGLFSCKSYTNRIATFSLKNSTPASGSLPRFTKIINQRIPCLRLKKNKSMS